ncbi:hypothetical protein OC835_003020 [Tilletia horrida]|nr:hypothetical protein OC835_003020 [Tilletia horrida]
MPATRTQKQRQRSTPLGTRPFQGLTLAAHQTNTAWLTDRHRQEGTQNTKKLVFPEARGSKTVVDCFDFCKKQEDGTTIRLPWSGHAESILMPVTGSKQGEGSSQHEEWRFPTAAEMRTNGLRLVCNLCAEYQPCPLVDLVQAKKHLRQHPVHTQDVGQSQATSKNVHKAAKGKKRDWTQATHCPDCGEEMQQPRSQMLRRHLWQHNHGGTMRDPSQLCPRHRAETEELREGKKKEWPEQLDWQGIEEFCKQKVWPTLREQIVDPALNGNFKHLKAEGVKNTAQATMVLLQGASHHCRPGMLGPQGMYRLTGLIARHFDKVINNRAAVMRFSPLTPIAFVDSCLVPAAIDRILAEHLGFCPLAEAPQFRHKSTLWGEMFFKDDDEN